MCIRGECQTKGEEMDEKLTEAETAAIEALKVAIKGLPKTLWFDLDEFDGYVRFWKRTGTGCGVGAGRMTCSRKKFEI